jgi:hypothetical protein
VIQNAGRVLPEIRQTKGFHLLFISSVIPAKKPRKKLSSIRIKSNALLQIITEARPSFIKRVPLIPTKRNAQRFTIVDLLMV